MSAKPNTMSRNTGSSAAITTAIASDPRAAWLLLDFDQRAATFRRVRYSLERTQAEMRERGLPQVLAARLERGD